MRACLQEASLPVDYSELCASSGHIVTARQLRDFGLTEQKLCDLGFHI
jgi:hypothetical protein